MFLFTVFRSQAIRVQLKTRERSAQKEGCLFELFPKRRQYIISPMWSSCFLWRMCSKIQDVYDMFKPNQRNHPNVSPVDVTVRTGVRNVMLLFGD